MELTDSLLERVVEFHGHKSPNLMIGCRASQLALNILEQKKTGQQALMVIAENSSEAVDAIQYLTGCTIGNQYLKIKDFGKHKYTFVVNQTGQAVVLSLKEIRFQEEKDYLTLENRLKEDMATVEDVYNMLALLDRWVSWLLSLSDLEMFTVVETKVQLPDINLSSKIVRCCHCREPVEEHKAIKCQGHFICQPCSELLTYEPEHIIWQ